MKTHPHGEWDCPAVFPVPSDLGHDFVCTRDVGHDGSHMASTGARVVAIWDSELAWCSHPDEEELWFGNTGREWVEVAG